MTDFGEVPEGAIFDKVIQATEMIAAEANVPEAPWLIHCAPICYQTAGLTGRLLADDGEEPFLGVSLAPPEAHRPGTVQHVVIPSAEGTIIDPTWGQAIPRDFVSKDMMTNLLEAAGCNPQQSAGALVLPLNEAELFAALADLNDPFREAAGYAGRRTLDNLYKMYLGIVSEPFADINYPYSTKDMYHPAVVSAQELAQQGAGALLFGLQIPRLWNEALTQPENE